VRAASRSAPDPGREPVPGRQAVGRQRELRRRAQRHPLISPIHPGFTLGERKSEEAPNAAIDAIPDDASVTAAAPLLPHLSQRNDIYLFGYPSPQNEYVVFAPKALGWPDPVYEQQWLDQNRAAYQPVFDRGGWVVWKRKS